MKLSQGKGGGYDNIVNITCCCRGYVHIVFILYNILSKKHCLDTFFIVTFYIGFVVTLQFFSCLYMYQRYFNPRYEISLLFTLLPTVISGLYSLPFAVVVNSNDKRKK